MNEHDYPNSINLKAESNFPYLVLDATDKSSEPTPPGFHIMHWHDDFQLIYVLLGSVSLKTLYHTHIIHKGEAVFINKNVVHQLQGTHECHYKSFVFPEYLVEFYPGGPAKKYITTLANNEQFLTYLFSECSTWHKNVLDLLENLIALEGTDSPAYEYEVLVHLSRLWLEIIKNINPPVGDEKPELAVRMQKFLWCIEQHYGEDLSLDELAKSANVSKSECLRCFKLTMQTTPYRYLMEYRLSKAAELLKSSDESIGNIADSVGFRQISHFGKCFKEKTGVSPREYRKNNAFLNL